MFRVSAVGRDRRQGDRCNYAQQEPFNAKKPGLILVNNPWGESNEKGLTAALKQAKGIKPAGIEKFEGNDVDVVPQLTRLKQAGADVLFLVGNVGPSAQVVKSLDRMGWKVPIVSHWGPAGGRFTELAGPSARDVHLRADLQLLRQALARRRAGAAALKAKYPDIKGPGDVTPAVGVANAYDAMHLAALAIEKAGTHRRRGDPRRLLQDRPATRPDQDLRQAVHAGQPRRRRRERLHLDPASATTRSCRWLTN